MTDIYKDTSNAEYHSGRPSPETLIKHLLDVPDQQQPIKFYVQVDPNAISGVPIWITSIGFDPNTKAAVVTFEPDVDPDLIARAQNFVDKNLGLTDEGPSSFFPPRGAKPDWD